MVTVALIFPGQGSQKVGMGKELADAFPEARDVFGAIEETLHFALTRLMWQGPEEELRLTHNAQPAILAHSLAVHAIAGPALSPALAAGHSLGEYTAYAAAGSLSVTEAARLVRRRGELMLEASRKRPGTMAAIVGLGIEDIERICREISRSGEVVVAANLNSPEQTVISGDRDAVARAGEACREAGAKRTLPLNVTGAFHSELMTPAREELERELAKCSLGDPSFPIVSNATAELVYVAAEARRLLSEQLIAPVRWVECMRVAIEHAPEETTFVEMGPGKVLSGLIRRIDRSVNVVHWEDPRQLDTFLEIHA